MMALCAEYTVHPNDIMMLFKANEPVNDDLLGKLPDNLEITYKAICENNKASNKEFADKTNQSERTIQSYSKTQRIELHQACWFR